jgi:uncharacterized delta-60 repeat protein
MSSLHRIAALSLTVLAASAVPAFAGDGDLDPGFGSGGHVLDPATDAASTAGVAASPDGTAVVLRSDGNGYRLTRYAANGSVVPSFGSGGSVASGTPAGTQTTPAGLVVQPDGRIVVASTTAPQGARSGLLEVDRYLAGGALDTGFGTGGTVTLQGDSGPVGDTQAVGIAMAPGGALVVEGAVDGDVGMAQLLARLTPGGALDGSFGSGGTVLSQLGPDGDPTTQPMSLGVTPSGQVITGGATGYDTPSSYLARYTPGGTLDPTYGTGGVAHPFSGAAATLSPWHAAVDAAGRVLIAGYDASEDAQIGRVGATGALDTSFASGGVATLPTGTDVNQFVLQPDGGILAIGDALDSQGYSAVGVLRYTTAGTLDRTFGSNGIAVTQLSNLTACAGVDAAAPGSWGVTGSMTGTHLLVVGGATTDGTCSGKLVLVRYGAAATGSGGGPGGAGGGSGSGGSTGVRPGHPTSYVTIPAGALKVVKGAVSVPATCHGSACSGTLTLRAKLVARHRTRTVVIGTHRFSVAAGRRTHVVVRLSAPGRAAVGKHRRLAVTALAVTGTGERRSAALTLRR